MPSPAWNELLSLPEGFAAQRYLDGLNLRKARWLAGATTVGAIVPLIVLLSNGLFLGAASVFAVLAANLTLLLLRERAFFRRHVGLFLLSHAVLVALALAVAAPDPMVVWSLSTFVVAPGFLLMVRWRDSRLWTLGAILLAIATWASLQPAAPEPLLPLLLVAAAWIGAVAFASRRITRRRLEGFRGEYRRQVSVERDRTRMRDELDDARAVQLSMLPQQQPELPWLDVASVSVPATEVGGDYYDYFVLDEDRIVLVVGDVSGHGMASGLVLAAVRSGLHLLRDHLDRPVEALGRLDGMLQATTPGRMFVTLQLVVVDRRSRRITVANAGHPPLLLVGQAGSRSLGAPARPLGTRLDAPFAEERTPYRPGDFLVLYTDGATELRNYRDEAFGADRLASEASRRRREPGARGLRDDLLASLTHFRADVPQEDDVTLVVVALESDAEA